MKINPKKFFISLCIAILLFGCQEAADPLNVAKAKAVDLSLVASNPALALVERFNMGDNLEKMAVHVAKSTHTYTMVTQKYGKEQALQMLTQEIQKLIPAYQSQWDAALAKAYSLHISPDELRSLATDGNKSPYINKLRISQSAVGKDMRKISSPILTKFVTQALSNAIN